MIEADALRLPGELRSLAQWAVSGASKAPLSVDSDGKLFNASVTRPSEWLSFEEALELVQLHRDLVTEHVDKKGRTIKQTGLHAGFILHESDPFTCIDFDLKDAETAPGEPEKWTTPEQWDLQWNIVQHLNSYTEYSRSGKGLHVWVKGSIGRGFRRDGVEVYSQERFIICTGDILIDKPITDRQMLLTNMVSQMRPTKKEFELEEFEPAEDDWYIFERAVNASNGAKFLKLYRGDFSEYRSQSEADLALLSMFTFYSESNEQCRRMFRDSALGKREKATKDNRYLNFNLTTIRQRQAREAAADISGIIQSHKQKEELAAAEIARIQGVSASGQSTATPFGQIEQRTVTSLHVQGQGNPAQAPQPVEIKAAQLAPMRSDAVEAGEKGLPWPPGFAGKIAQFIYASANRPVKEVAIVAALGLLAGITGKAWHIPQSGLNLYIILIARSAIGKETMHSGISSLITACTKENPSFHKFVDFTDFVSGPALVKACVANQCFLNVSGEWGRKLKRLAEDNRDGALQTLRTQMTNLYQKSGPQAIVGGISYSSTDNNVASVAGVSYSMIGETTPGTFYEALTEDMMADGFLSRFLTIEYDGLRVASNEYAITAPDVALKTALNNMAMQADLMMAKDYSQLIGRDEKSAAIMAAFEKECDGQINGTDDESRRQMWNRAALKSLRLAGILAVADNYLTPCITEELIKWAIDVVRRDINTMRRRLDGGDVGSGDDSRERKVVMVLRDYLINPSPPGYKLSDSLRVNAIVPRAYISNRCGRVASFYKHRMGRDKAIDETIASMIANGYLMEVQKDKMIEGYGFHGKAFRIIKLPNYEDESRK